MSDKVEERREQERIDKQRLEQVRLQNRQAEVKREFNRVLEQVKNTDRQMLRKEEGKTTEQRIQVSSLQEKLAGRRGIQNESVRKQIYSQQEESKSKRRKAETIVGEEVRDRRHKSEREASVLKSSSASIPVGNVGKRSGQQQQGQERRKGGSQVLHTVLLQNATGSSDNRFQVASTHHHVGYTKGGRSLQDKTNRIIDLLTREISTAIDQRGLTVFNVQLKHDILAGANLTLRKTSREGRGIHLSMHSGDAEVAELLSASNTAAGLSKALNHKGIALERLEVNGKIVLG
jgi:hypothetical protein